MMSNEYPKSFARFYDTIYNHLRDGIDNKFHFDHIKRTEGKVLEVGVGTGRFFIDALNSGTDIYGIDVSCEMVQVLLNKLDRKDHHRISVQSIADFEFDNQFDLILAPFRVIMHVLDKKEQLKALNNVYKHLAPGGKFIFDTFIPNLNQLINGLRNVTDFEGEYEPGKKLKRIVSTRPDFINQLINIHFRLEWDENLKTQSEEWELPLRFFFRYELEHLIERSNFKNYKIFGDYSENELSENSKEFIVVCQK